HKAGKDERVQIEDNVICKLQRAEKDYTGKHASETDKNCTGHHKQPTRAIHEKKFEMPPAISPGFEMWRSRAAVWPQRSWHLFDAKLSHRSPNDHLTGKFHPGRSQIQTSDRIRVESPQATVKIPNRDSEKQATQEAENWIA